ncbi:hypothetical protein Glove_109g402 [Diversispora epigaea]|uniref:Uncharacterized protein n=1 Tax=Diversispora epigaea TaxID=1348612 RepID=A0A397J562_9GLOM|nr:hypothetical protein Glove_109g402 [Diversispora epigaea]
MFINKIYIKLGCKWDFENHQWERYRNSEVALKRFDNFMKIHLKIYNEYVASIQFYGITQDPETHSYRWF